MSRKLKKLLKNAYNVQPERKYSFLNSLKSNPVWRKLHPLSTLSVISPSALLILSTIAVIAVGTGIVSHNFRKDTPEPPVIPDIPPVVTLTTSIPTVTTVPQTVLSVQPTELFTVQKTEPQKTLSNVATTAKTTISYVQQTELFFGSENSVTVPETSPQTVPGTSHETTAVTTTSVYYSHLLRHDYTLDEIAHDDTLLYGYPDSDIANQMFAGYNADYIEMSIGFMQSPVIEGEITSIEYTDFNGLPLTICDVLISEVFDFYGEDVLNAGDTIKIASYGGYMPVSKYIALNPESELFSGWSQEQIDSTIIYEDGGNETEPKVSDKYLFVLNPEKQEVNGKPVYARLTGCDIFQFRREGDGYTCCNSATDGYITYEKLKKITNDKYYFSDPDSDRKIMIKDDADLLMGLQNYYYVDSNGKVTFVDSTTTDDGFFPYHSEDDYKIKWTDSGVEISYRFDSISDIFKTITLDYPK